MKSWWRKNKKYFWIGFSLLVPYVIVWFIIALFGTPSSQHCFGFKNAFYPTVSEPFVSVISFILTFSIAFFQFNKDFIEDKTELIKQIEINQEKQLVELYKKVDYTLSRSNIVFETGINEFNDEHLLAFYRILDALKTEKEINIYAIDNSDPRTWWSDTMIGYLALLSNMVDKDKVHRIFVCRKNELLSPVFAKTIGLHSLMGFKTYIIEYDKYNDILKTINRTTSYDTSKIYDIGREVVLWTRGVNGAEEIFPIDFNLDKLQHSKRWTNVKCFQSFWTIDSEYNFRTVLQNKNESKELSNYYGKTRNSKTIDIWFEFIAKEKCKTSSNPYKANHWEKMPTLYLELIKAILLKMVCCKEAIEVPTPLGNTYGIEIKTAKCPPNNCTHKPAGFDCINSTPNIDFDYTTMSNIRAILRQYYSIL